MIAETISRATARRLYDELGSALDRSDRYEARAKARALELLQLEAGQRVLHVAVGTGREHARLAGAVAPRGTVVGFDLSRGMLALARQRAATPLCEGDAVALPFATGSFDRLFSAYMLDLLPAADLPRVLAEFRRVLRPDGRMVLVSLTHGCTPPSRLFVALWTLVYRLRPEALGGCRPLHLAPFVEQAGFRLLHNETLIQRAFPSEIVVGIRDWRVESRD